MKRITIFILLVFVIILSACALNINKSSQVSKKDPTIDWPKYTNIKYGYEFQYPSDISYLEPEGASIRGLLLDMSDKKDIQEANILILGYKDNELLFTVQSGLDSEYNLVPSLSNKDNRYDISSVNINGINFDKYSVKDGIYNGFDTAYFYKSNNGSIMISFVDSQLAQQILSTFKILN